MQITLKAALAVGSALVPVRVAHVVPALALLTIAGITFVGALGPEAAYASPDPLRIVTDSLPRGEKGVPYTSNVEASGGTGVALTWRLVGGRLPEGLTIDDRIGAQELWTGQWQTTGSNPLTECSGLAASALNPGILWVHEDSAGPPEIVAIREDGTVVHRYRIVRFTNEPSFAGSFAIDYEDIALGPGPTADTEYLYLGDIGDNLAARGPPNDTLRVLRLLEPVVAETNGGTTDVEVEVFSFTYPSDGVAANRFDAEALLVDWESGTPYIVTKRHGLGSGFVYKFPMPLDGSWTTGRPTTLLPVGTEPLILPIWPTAGDASRDGQRVVLRTYLSEAYEYFRPSGGSFDDVFLDGAASRVHRFDSPAGPKHEGLGYGGDGTTLFTATEDQGTPIERVDAAEGVTTTVIVGTPTTAGVFSFSVEVRDSSGRVTTRELELEVGKASQTYPVFMPYVLAF